MNDLLIWRYVDVANEAKGGLGLGMVGAFL